MDTTNTATISNPTATTSLGQSSLNTANTKIRNTPDSAMGAGAGIAAGNIGSEWNTNTAARSTSTVLGTRSASVYSAPAVVSTAAAPATANNDDAQSTAAASNGYNAATDMPSYTRPSYSRSESNGNYLAVGVLLVSLTLRKS